MQIRVYAQNRALPPTLGRAPCFAEATSCSTLGVFLQLCSQSFELFPVAGQEGKLGDDTGKKTTNLFG